MIAKKIRRNKKKSNKHDIRSEVTSIIAHQLKTPLAGIKSSIQVVLSRQIGSLNDDQQEYLRIALDEVDRMILLVKDLLDAARIDQKKLELNMLPTDLAKLIQATIDNVSTFAHATNTSISFTVKGDVPLVRVDATKIQQAINNIIDNAIHYEQGRGQIKVRLIREGQKIIFSCQDSGIGISKEEVKKIFSKFYRSPKAVELVPMGSGLGLFIARAIIEQSGGKVWFVSKLGRGTTFYFSLPVQFKHKRS